MICSNCGNETPTVRYCHGKESCPHCSSLRVSEGNFVDGLLTRNSLRVRSEALKYAGDLIQPRVYDKYKRDYVPNPDFIKQYPNRVKDTFSKEELHGTPKMVNTKKKSK